MERSLEARERVSELWVGTGQVTAPMQCPFEIRSGPELFLCLGFLAGVL